MDQSAGRGRTRAGEAEKSAYTAVALARGLQVLELLAAARAALPLAEIARRAGLTRGVAFRLTHTLEQAGYLQRVDKIPSYRPGPRVMGLGFSYLRSLGLAELARPTLEALRDATACSVHLAVLDGRDVFYVDRLAARSGALHYLDIGDRSPAHASAIGHALLAGLDHKAMRQLYRGFALTAHGTGTPTTTAALEAAVASVRMTGCAVSVGALHPNVVAVAAPFRGESGAVVGALSATNLEPPQLPELTDAVRRAADEITELLGGVRGAMLATDAAII
jgi:DNA-binding IclR family transcriptional regulator